MVSPAPPSKKAIRVKSKYKTDYLYLDGGVNMDWTVILGAVISGTVSLIVCIITQFAQNKVTRALLEYRLTELEKKVDKHNNLVERMYRAEENIAVLTERMDDSKSVLSKKAAMASGTVPWQEPSQP